MIFTMSHIPTPRFETDRLLLRELTLSDAPTYQQNFNNYEVIQHLSAAVPWPYPDDGVEYFLNNVVFPNQGKNRWDWGLFLKTNPSEVIGTISFFLPGVPEHRGFWLAKKYWGMGLMTEAVAPIMGFAFNTLKMESIIFSNAVGNDRSRRVKEKTGATFVETRPVKFVSPLYTESEYWELSKTAWEQGFK
jgi:ribosomal-protein-alanine N-acetyltransferase